MISRNKSSINKFKQILERVEVLTLVDFQPQVEIPLLSVMVAVYLVIRTIKAVSIKEIRIIRSQEVCLEAAIIILTLIMVYLEAIIITTKEILEEVYLVILVAVLVCLAIPTVTRITIAMVYLEM